MLGKKQEKLLRVISKKGFIALSLCLAATILVFIFSPFIYGSKSIFYAFESSNTALQDIVRFVPNLIKAFTTVVITITCFKLIKLISKLSVRKNNRTITIMCMVLSLLRWIVVIICVLMVLGCFGVDTTTLLASAGILTLVIGLGAQSLVADIIAGFFLVVERAYSVGDIITIDGWRGTVKDIGIRVTKVEDAGGNIKTINNSDVRNVINQTNELSVAKVYLPLDYGESLEKAELVLKDSFLDIANKIPDIVEGPFYKGVSDLKDSSVEMLVVAKCDENNIFQVQRDLTRELYLVFTKNNIKIPFNQMTISYREDEDKKPSKKIEKEASTFVNEQKELTKDLGESHNE